MFRKSLLLTIIAFLFLSGNTVYAAEVDDYDMYYNMLFSEIPSILVASKKAELANEAPLSHYIIDNEEMQRWGIRNLYEMLARTPGYSWYNVGLFGQYGTNVRGLDSIWRYSCSIELSSYGDFGHWVFSPNFFKNAEVVRGPAGVTWGSQAESGLVNLNIRDDLDGFESHIELGNMDRIATDLLYGKKFDENGNGCFIGFHYEEQDYDEIEHTIPNYAAYDKLKIPGIRPSWFVLGKIKTDKFKAIYFQDFNEIIDDRSYKYGDEFAVNFEENLGSPLFYRAESDVLRGEYFIFNEEDFQLNIYAEHNLKQWYVLQRKMSSNRKLSWGWSGFKSFLDNSLELSWGGELYAKEKSDDPFYFPESTWEDGASGTADWWDSSLPTETEYSNFYLQGKYILNDKLSFLLAGRYDKEKDAPKDDTIFSGPRIGIIYKLTDKTVLKYTYNATDRRPRGNERSDFGQTNNSSLEELAAHEVILNYKNSKFFCDLTLFSQKLSDQIVQLQQIDPSLDLTSGWGNSGGLESSGVEWAMKYRLTDNILLYWNGHYHDLEVVGDINPQMSDGRPPFVAKYMNFVGLEYNIADYCFFNLDFRSNMEIPYFDSDGQEAETDANFVDMTIRTKKFFNDQVSFSFVALNLLDNDDYLPAFGERHGNKNNGEVQPEGLRFYLKTQIKLN